MLSLLYLHTHRTFLQSTPIFIGMSHNHLQARAPNRSLESKLYEATIAVVFVLFCIVATLVAVVVALTVSLLALGRNFYEELSGR